MSKNSRTRPSHKRSSQTSADRSGSPKVVDSSTTRPRGPAITPEEPSKLRDAAEWTRGKVELFGESTILPTASWVRDKFERATGRIGNRMRLPIGMRGTRFFAGWSWDGQGVRMLKQTMRILVLAAVCAAVVVVLSAGVARLTGAIANFKSPFSSSDTGNANGTPTGVPAITIRSVNGNDATPPPMPKYTFGLWSSNNTPGVGSPVTIFARVSEQSKPLPGVTVTISIFDHTMTLTTNQDGIASFNVNAGGRAQVPVVITGTVRLENVDYQGQAFFTPI